MRWLAGRRCKPPVWTSEHRQGMPQRIPRALAALLAGVAVLLVASMVAACGSPSVNLPGGSYNNETYGFHITYPRNWQANPYDATATPGDSAASAIPFTLVITRTGDSRASASLISTCTVTVMSLKNSDIAKGAADLASNKLLEKVTIGGVQGYKSKPITQEVPNSQISVTHTDFYVVHGDYEYQLSTDSVKGDNADSDLDSIIASFGFNG